jgi:hypothetical protein
MRAIKRLLLSWWATFGEWVNRAVLGKTCLHCIGDSHVQVFDYIRQRAPFAIGKYYLRVCSVPGATVSGLDNPNSKTQALPVFEKYIKTIKKSDSVLFMIGEIDCGFVIWYRAEKYGEQVSELLEKTFTNYQMFIEKFRQVVGNKIITVDAPLPTIKDGVVFGEVANLRKGIAATQRERTDLTLQFNSKIAANSKAASLIHLALGLDLIDLDTRIVKDTYLNTNPADHHLDNKKFSGLLINRINALTQL